METSTEYHKFAQHCERLANQVETERHRSVLEKWQKFGRNWQMRPIDEANINPALLQSPFSDLLLNGTKLVPCTLAPPLIDHL
jgi:hypothetical protein